MSVQLYKLIKIQTAKDPLGNWADIENLLGDSLYYSEDGNIITIQADDVDDLIENHGKKLNKEQKKLIKQIKKDLEKNTEVDYYAY
jgi:hypothetical protein